MAPQAEPITTVSEIDEALWWVWLSCPRDGHYGRIVDALLDQRNRIASGHPPLPHPTSPPVTTRDGHEAGQARGRR